MSFGEGEKPFQTKGTDWTKEGKKLASAERNHRGEPSEGKFEKKHMFPRRAGTEKGENFLCGALSSECLEFREF